MNKKERKAIFSLTITENELHIMKNMAEWLEGCDSEEDQKLGERLRKTVHRTAKKMGFEYLHK